MVNIKDVNQIVIFITLAAVIVTNVGAVSKYDFLMPNVRPTKAEIYLCTPIRIAPRTSYSIVGFEPNATMHTAHHMLLYGCAEPGSNEAVWNCGEMQSKDRDHDFHAASPCKSGSQVVYAWARDAPPLTLPEGVGFLVGEDSPIKYMVLQVHYMNKFEEGQTDNSGVFLHYTNEVLSKQAGVILLGTSGAIPPMREEHMETSCAIKENKVIHPFAYRVHTHALGKVVAGYVVRQHIERDYWTLLGKRDPQTPQMFYPIFDKHSIGKGDILAARCTMKSDRETWTLIGPTNKDEMCNFYLMYWVENDEPLDQKYCFTAGPPDYYWSTAPENFNHIPELDASSL